MAEIINFVYVTILFLFFFHVATISAESHECDIAADCPPHMYLYKATCVALRVESMLDTSFLLQFTQ
ncbi:late nodulin [Medicago truncatula]|uniref:Late nodulin n=1 Tax=Medicago truncatula TaxID=3880 RepID=A0A072UQT2_MEDTR|nr:late nodulin [Medicago truncatula]